MRLQAHLKKGVLSPMTSRHSRSYIDYSNELSTVSFNVPDITAGNIVAVVSDINDIGLALLDLTLGNLKNTQTVLSFTGSNPNPPADPYAQRELKWLVNYRDDVTLKLYQMEIPTADLTGNLLTNTDQADLASADWAAFVTAFEAGAVSPDGNAVTIVSAYVVGRNT